MPLEELLSAWTGTLEKIFPTQAEKKELTHEIGLYTQRNQKAACNQKCKAKSVYSCIPGTNCEVDTARAFERAGAIADILVVKNLTPN